MPRPMDTIAQAGSINRSENIISRQAGPCNQQNTCLPFTNSVSGPRFRGPRSPGSSDGS